MIVSKTAKIWLDYHRAHSKNNTVRAYEWTIGKFCVEFGDTDLLDLSVDDILSFLNEITEGRKTQTKRVRFSHLTDRLKAFVRESEFEDHARVLPICYEACRAMVKKAGELAGIYLRPHNLRRHSATFASRWGSCRNRQH